MEEGIIFREIETESHRRRTFDKSLDDLTIMDFTKMATWMRKELGYEPALCLYIHETIRQYVAVRKGKNSSITGRDIYDHLKVKAPMYYIKIVNQGKITMKDARVFRDNGWKVVPECI